MTPRSDLEIKGNFLVHPFSDLLAETAAAALSGSLRLENERRKAVFYFKAGRVVFAVSNARSARLFDILLRRKKIGEEDLKRIPDYDNDIKLASFLQEKHFLNEPDRQRLFSEQIEGILIDALSWRSGEWTFSSLARIRDGLEFDVNVTGLLVDFARSLPDEGILGRFRSVDEKMERSGVSSKHLALTPSDAFILSRLEAGQLMLSELIDVSGMSQVAVLRSAYTLWLAGLIVRQSRRPAFPADAVASMRGARLALKREAKLPGVPARPAGGRAAKKPAEHAEVPSKEPELTISLEDYLKRVESAVTYYDILGVQPKADIDELKRAYFALARQFHPDRYHAEGGETLKRIQNAFTELAQAHETLKNVESREVYDYRMRKELAEREKAEQSGMTGHRSVQFAQAADAFEQGFTLLMDGNTEAAVPFLARAAHYSPKNPRYRAYYGKALSADESRRHRAESEMQEAVRMDPSNATYRLLLAEFFVDNNLKKRAEGELKRLLSVHPKNSEALNMLEALRKP